MHSLALSVDGRLFTWGHGNRGQLGQKLERDSHCIVVPTEVKGDLLSKRVKVVSAGGDHSAVITEAGNLFTFGGGESGQLGHGINEDLAWPRQVKSCCSVLTGGWQPA